MPHALLALPAEAPRRDRPAAPPRFAPQERAVLELLRAAAARARCARQQDMFRACALLSMDRARSREAAADALARGLPQALGRAPVFYRPGTAETSFDEAWLMRLAASARTGDDASLAFGLKARVAPHLQRGTAFLLRAISEQNAPL